ncbi:hypothetical protein SSX86_001923 [Deinandra increscens subsp. villosa]|uniref:Uncharacterized protein n=1 Tax=Deinandra increscens subsp. villosa TaxID=3103831 RepID=A0AAP0HD50_9ASTR
MVADVSSTTTPPNSKVLSPAPDPAPAKPRRVPLLPSGSENNGRYPNRRPKSKDVTSRYLSYNTASNSAPTPKKRFPSPPVPVASESPASNRRDQSVQRRYSRTVEMSSSAKMLTKTSARSLSVSFQGESFALPVSKVGRPADDRLRNRTPERRKSPATPGKISDYSPPIDRQKRPPRSRKGSFMTMSVDFTNEKLKLSGSEITDTKLEPDNNLETVCESHNSDHAVSDSESISSGSSFRGGGPRAIVVPARFWQETISLLRRVQPVAPPLVKNNKPISGCKVLQDDPKLPPRGGSSISSSTINNLGNTPSILSFCADSRRGKVGEKTVTDAHLLRLLHNKHMQWRFANAKADAAMVVQRAAAKKSLYNAWVTVSKLWHSVISKRLQMQQLKENLKLHSLLKKQMLYLDNWELTERDHSSSLAGAIAALESSSLCLPVLCGAKVDIQNLKDAVCSAGDMMQAMVVSLCSLETKVENVNLMASELAHSMKTECSLLDQCNDLLSAFTLLEVSLQRFVIGDQLVNFSSVIINHRHPIFTTNNLFGDPNGQPVRKSTSF